MLLSVALLCGVAGCSAVSPTPTQTPAPSETPVALPGDWFFDTGADSAGSFENTDSMVTAVTFTDTSVGGQICNSYTGALAIQGHTITMGPIASTEMYCTSPQGIMDLETRFLQDLGAVTSAEIVDGKLHLTGDGISLTFVGLY